VRGRTALGPALIVVAALALVAFVGTAGSQTPSGQPLTKQEYFNESIRFMEKEAKTNGLYYKLALDPLPPKKCASEARRYHGKLAQLLTEGTAVVPPPEIAEIHARLLATGGQVVRRIGRIAKRAKSGKVVCGEDFAHPAENEVARKIYRAYQRSGFDPTLEQLRNLGYVPSGE
jgi:hypothetical protein